MPRARLKSRLKPTTVINYRALPSDRYRIGPRRPPAAAGIAYWPVRASGSFCAPDPPTTRLMYSDLACQTRSPVDADHSRGDAVTHRRVLGPEPNSLLLVRPTHGQLLGMCRIVVSPLPRRDSHSCVALSAYPEYSCVSSAKSGLHRFKRLSMFICWRFSINFLAHSGSLSNHLIDSGTATPLQL